MISCVSCWLKMARPGMNWDDLDRFDTVMSRRRFLASLGGGDTALPLLGFGASAEIALQGFGRGLIPAAWADATPPISGKMADLLVLIGRSPKTVIEPG